MVNTLYLKNIEKEFLENLDNIKESNLNINNKKIELIKVSKNQDSHNNKFKKLIQKKLDFYEINIDENTKLEIEGSANIDININKDSTLELYFEKDTQTTVSINLNVKEKVKVNLIDFSNNKNLNKILNVNLENNSILETSQFDINSKINITEVELKKNSNYELKSAILSDNISNYIVNSSIHIGRESKSNMVINTASKNESQLICDGIINIKQNAPSSEGHQKIAGLLIDEKSRILSEPILKIENNDVKCSHGCSITQIKDDILFYMKSKGLNKEEITNLILKGHFNLAIESINDEKIKEKIENKLTNTY